MVSQSSDDTPTGPIARGMRDRRLQRALLQFFKPENYFEVHEALVKAGRRDLIGGGCDALIPAHPPREALEARRARAEHTWEAESTLRDSVVSSIHDFCLTLEAEIFQSPDQCVEMLLAGAGSEALGGTAAAAVSRPGPGGGTGSVARR